MISGAKRQLDRRLILHNNWFKSIALIFCLSACVTRLPTPAGIREISLSNYEDLVQSKTQDIRIYNGFTNQLEIYATKMDSDMNEGYLSHAARLFQWSISTYNDEKNKVILKQGTQSEFLVSFFTPERKNDDLSSSNSAWKIFLDSDGIRYQGTAKKIKRNLAELEAFFPHHNRWFTMYSITFPIATSLSENKPSILTFTSGLGSTQLRF
jgi:hypothetical protein